MKAVQCILGLHSRLLRLYPHEFRTQFEEEMLTVFADSISDACERGWIAVSKVCVGELLDWPKEFLVQHWLNAQNRLQENRTRRAATGKPTPDSDTPGILPIPGGMAWHFIPIVSGNERLKRAFDVAFAASLLVLTTPLMLVVAVLVKVDSPGPMMFHQQRLGRNGRLFTLRKFRSMVPNAPRLQAQEGATDPRLTRVGRFIRSLYIDELPTLFSVLKGDMSVFGPRPGLPKS